MFVGICWCMCTFQFSRRNLTHSEFLYGTTIESENKRVKSFPQEYQNTFTIVHAEKYGGEKCGFRITEQQLVEVANLSQVLDGTDDYLEPNGMRKAHPGHW